MYHIWVLRTNLLVSIIVAMPAIVSAQTPPAAPRTSAVPQSSYANAFPQHAPSDPAMVERGRAIYGVNCQFCHGSDARGGEGGPNLLRSETVLNDQKGELIALVVQNGRVDLGMPRFSLSGEQVADVAAFIHSFRVAGYDNSRMKPPTIVVGNRAAGEAYFKTKCASCHSVTGDLKGIGKKFPDDPRALQQMFVMPGGGQWVKWRERLARPRLPWQGRLASAGEGRRHSGARRRLHCHPDRLRRHPADLSPRWR